MSCRDAKQGDRGTFLSAATLLPVAKRVNGDADSLGELCLRESDKAAQCSDVSTGLEDPGQEALADAGRNGPGEVALRQPHPSYRGGGPTAQRLAHQNDVGTLQFDRPTPNRLAPAPSAPSGGAAWLLRARGFGSCSPTSLEQEPP
jgi:hypothetical protein